MQVPPPPSAERSLKRRLTSPPDLSFFTPAASSFQPLPYAPSTRPSNPSCKNPKQTVQPKNTSQEPSTVTGMDPTPNDPNALFLSPPFNNIPQLKKYPQGLTYNVLAENPEWFLLPRDYIRFDVNDAQAILYPSELEPPRGWCPAKKKDLQQRGSEGWPEGEEPRLRCTFCRRTYAGVNAKSMWRRHVYEKHKVAMENRVRPRGTAIESAVKPRGRGANKENKTSVNRNQNNAPGERIIHLDVQPQPAGNTVEGSPHRSRFRSFPAQEPAESSSSLSTKYNLSPSRIDFGADGASSRPLSQSTIPSLSPPPTPSRSRVSSTPSPSTPYDPLVTPSFRHSPARLPSDKPWRYSPGHPFFARTRDLMMPVAPSPLVGLKNVSTCNSPLVFPRKDKSKFFDLNTPESVKHIKGTPLRSLARSKSFSALTDKESSEASPISHGNLSYSHRKGMASITSVDDWLSDSSTSFSSIASPRSLLKGADPFVDIWTPVKGSGLRGGLASSSPMHPGLAFCSPSMSLIGTDSPVLRSSESAKSYSRPGPSRLGNLMEAFTLSKEGPVEEDDSDDDSDDSFHADSLMSPLRVDRNNGDQVMEDIEPAVLPTKLRRQREVTTSPEERSSKKRRCL